MLKKFYINSINRGKGGKNPLYSQMTPQRPFGVALGSGFGFLLYAIDIQFIGSFGLAIHRPPPETGSPARGVCRRYHIKG